MTEYTMVQLRLPEGQSSLADVAKRLGVAVGDLDANYGVVPSDPADRLFVAMVDARKADTISASLGAADAASDPAEGIFANPAIAPFGPPES